LSKAGYLFDVNIVVALIDPDHVHHRKVRQWIKTVQLPWGTCAFTEAGFVRIATDRRTGMFTVKEANEALELLSRGPRFQFWPIHAGWAKLAAPFLHRIMGHQQITDAYLLGLAVNENGVLATLDKGIRHLAGERYAKHVLVLE
jgi:toxin-antitoxin system PIN domain toxin